MFLLIYMKYFPQETSPLKVYESIMNYITFKINQGSNAMDLNMPLLKHVEFHRKSKSKQNTMLSKVFMYIKKKNLFQKQADESENKEKWEVCGNTKHR